MGVWKMWMEMQSGGSLIPVTALIPERAELAQNIWLLVCTQCLQSWFSKVGRRIKSYKLPSGPSPTGFWHLGMAIVSFSSHLKPATTKCG